MKPRSASRQGFRKLLPGLFLVFLFNSFNLSADSVLVTFRVNMKNAYPPNGVYIGSDWAGWSLDKFQKMSDPDHDSIFELTVYLPAGDSYNYRYTKGNTGWGGFEALSGTPCGFGPNHDDRNILVPQSNTVLGIVCFDDCADCGSTARINLNLGVDMSGVTVSADGVHVTGNFNNWNTSSLELTDEDHDNIYTISIPVIPNLDYEYRFLNGKTTNDAEVVFGTCEFRSKRRITILNEDITIPVVKFGSCNAGGDPISDVKIACIGNSITEGGAGNYFNSWPIQLRDMLGTGYYTENLGVSGTTMSKSGDSPWWNQPQYDYTFSLNPDIILIKLGTNDSKSGNWKPDNYKAAYVEMIDQFRAMPSLPEIYMVTPAKAYSSAYNINDNTIVMKVIPILHQVAFEKAVHLIDMYNATSNMPNLFPDGIHPNAAGAGVIAQKMKENLIRVKPLISQVEPTSDTTTNILYQWYFNDVMISSSNHRTINVTQNGTYRVVVKISNLSNDMYVSDPFSLVMPQGTATVGLTTDYDAVYGLNEKTGSNHILIYPNPASGCIHIDNAASSDVTIYNELGSTLLTQKNISEHQLIPVAELQSGVYYVRLSKDRSISTQRVVIIKG